MDYQFPRIEHLNDVLPAIEGRDEFIVAHREWGIVVNYMVSMTDTFPEVGTWSTKMVPGAAPYFSLNGDANAIIRRECRGLLFYPDGRIMSRRLHKFFNVNERNETQMGHIDLSRPHVILEKLDGSMITPVYTEAGVRWGTKMGITEVSMQAEVFVTQNPKYLRMAEDCLKFNHTPVFEWCSRKQRIVVDYPEDRLVLTAIRENETGKYWSYWDMRGYADTFDIETVRAHDGTAANMEQLIADTRAAEGMEGWIVRFDDGHMLKIKGDWYVRIHKTKDSLTLEKNVIDLIVNEKMDDVKPYMLEDDRARVEKFEDQFWRGVANQIEVYDRYWGSVQAHGMDRKAYAQNWMPTVQKNDPFAAQFVFGKFDDRDSRKMILDQIRKNTGTATKVDSVRHLWGGSQWSYHFEGDS